MVPGSDFQRTPYIPRVAAVNSAGSCHDNLGAVLFEPHLNYLCHVRVNLTALSRIPVANEMPNHLPILARCQNGEVSFVRALLFRTTLYLELRSAVRTNVILAILTSTCRIGIS